MRCVVDNVPAVVSSIAVPLEESSTAKLGSSAAVAGPGVVDDDDGSTVVVDDDDGTTVVVDDDDGSTVVVDEVDRNVDAVAVAFAVAAIVVVLIAVTVVEVGVGVVVVVVVPVTSGPQGLGPDDVALPSPPLVEVPFNLRKPACMRITFNALRCSSVKSLTDVPPLPRVKTLFRVICIGAPSPVHRSASCLACTNSAR